MKLESDDLEDFTREIRRLIESNRLFLEQVSDGEHEDPDLGSDDDSGTEQGTDGFEEL